MLEEFITPIVKVSKGGRTLSFYSLPEYRKWLDNTPGSHTWTVKYYKGLGTSSTHEAREYFANIRRNRIPFRYSGHPCDDKIELAFAKKRIDDRKNWLTGNGFCCILPV